MSGMEAMFAVGAASGLMSGYAQQQASEYNAQVMEQQAKIDMATSMEKRRVMMRQGAKHIASQRAAIAASGVAMEGSALEAVAASEASLARDLAIERFNAKYAAQMARSEATATRVAGDNAMTGGMVGAGVATAFLL